MHFIADPVKLTLKLLMRHLSDKAAEWEDIGLELDIDYGELKRIKADNRGDSKSCLRELFDKWLSRVDPEPSWKAIADAIEELGDEKKAEEIRNHAGLGGTKCT